jgi:hypothetical protein
MAPPLADGKIILKGLKTGGRADGPPPLGNFLGTPLGSLNLNYFMIFHLIVAHSTITVNIFDSIRDSPAWRSGAYRPAEFRLPRTNCSKMFLTQCAPDWGWAPYQPHFISMQLASTLEVSIFPVNDSNDAFFNELTNELPLGNSVWGSPC